MIVADASAVGAILLPDESGAKSEFALRMLTENDIAAPHHWPAEVTSLIVNANRRGRLSPQQYDVALESAETLMTSVQIAPAPRLARLAAHAVRHGLSVYDACYALLCEQLEAPLLSFDARLSSAAERGTITVLRP